MGRKAGTILDAIAKKKASISDIEQEMLPLKNKIAKIKEKMQKDEDELMGILFKEKLTSFDGKTAKARVSEVTSYIIADFEGLSEYILDSGNTSLFQKKLAKTAVVEEFTEQDEDGNDTVKLPQFLGTYTDKKLLVTIKK